MPASEARTILLLLALAVAGQGVRYLIGRPGEPPGQIQVLGAVSAGSPRAQRDSSMQQAKPLRLGERVDVDHASAAELARLPKVGIRLAKIIIADREAHGPFRSLPGLDRVGGIGPGLLKLLAPHVAFGGSVPGSVGLDVAGATPPAIDLNTAGPSELDALPGIGPSRAAAILHYRERHGRFTSVNELEQVPGFGRAAVARLQDRLTIR